MEKLENVDSFEELKALAKEAAIQISDEELKQYFDEETMALKLGSEDLEKVAGGKYNPPPSYGPRGDRFS